MKNNLINMNEFKLIQKLKQMESKSGEVVQIRTKEDAEKYLVAEELPDNPYIEKFKQEFPDCKTYDDLLSILKVVQRILGKKPTEIIGNIDLDSSGLMLNSGERISGYIKYGYDWEVGYVVVKKDGKELGKSKYYDVGPGGM